MRPSWSAAGLCCPTPALRSNLANLSAFRPDGAGKTTLIERFRLSASTNRSRPGQTPQRGNPAIGYLPQLRTVHPDLRMRGIDFIASSVHGGRWGLPVLSAAESRMIDETISSAGARISPRGPYPRCPAANGSVSCWHKRCSGRRGYSFSTSR